MANLSGMASDWMLWLFVLLAFGLVAEVASHRLREASQVPVTDRSGHSEESKAGRGVCP
jgi:hypothetical protein